MSTWTSNLSLCSAVLATLFSPPQISSAQTGDCTPEQRRQEFRALQTHVMRNVPRQVDSLKKAVRPEGSLAGWRLSHGHVVLASAGAVGLDNITAKDPLPQLLLYAPSPRSAPADWLDFDGTDGPYRLVGWAYIGPYTAGSEPPSRRCVSASDWWVHEAGWHLMDGGMHLTPGAASEPPRPDLKAEAFFWHPQVWVVHFWAGKNGVPTVALDNPARRDGGLELPHGTFFRPSPAR